MKKIVFLLFVAVVFLQCTNNKPLPNGYELLDRDGKSGLMPPITLKPVRTAHYRSISPVGSNTTLLLGSHDGLSSSIVLDSGLFKSASVDTNINLQSAELHLRVNAVTASDLALTISVHRVVKSWDERTVIADSLIDGYESSPLFTADLTPQSTEWLKIPIPDLHFVRAWIKDAYKANAEMHGILIKSQDDGMVQFASSEASFFPPAIKLYHQNNEGQVDTVSVSLSADAGLLEYPDAPYQLTVSPPSLRVGAGSGYRSLLIFDLSPIPQSATIHHALLSFAVDNQGSSTRVSGQMSISILAVSSDSTWEKPQELAVYSVSAPPFDVAVDDNDKFPFDDATPVQYVSRTVQRWLNGVYPNYGFLIYPSDEGNDWQKMAFHSGAQDTLLAPTLTVTYSLPAENRFTNP